MTRRSTLRTPLSLAFDGKPFRRVGVSVRLSDWGAPRLFQGSTPKRCRVAGSVHVAGRQLGPSGGLELPGIRLSERRSMSGLDECACLWRTDPGINCVEVRQPGNGVQSRDRVPLMPPRDRSEELRALAGHRHRSDGAACRRIACRPSGSEGSAAAGGHGSDALPSAGRSVDSCRRSNARGAPVVFRVFVVAHPSGEEWKRDRPPPHSFPATTHDAAGVASFFSGSVVAK